MSKKIEKYIEKVFTRHHCGRDACWDKYYILFSDGEEVELSTLLGKIMEENLNWNKGGSFRY